MPTGHLLVATAANDVRTAGTTAPEAEAGSTTDTRITATARWQPPVLDGGSVITGYRVTALRLDASGTVVDRVASAIRPAETRALTMLLPRKGRYAFTVRAVNAFGQSVPSARSATVAGR